MAHGFRWRSEAARLFPARSRLLKSPLIGAALLVGSLGLVVIFRPSPPVTAVVMALPNGIPPQKPTLIERWIPPIWSWAWRLKELILGRIKPIELKAAIFHYGDLSNSVSPLFLLREPRFANTNGLQVWMLSQGELDAVCRGLEQTPGNEILAQPRVLGGTESSATFTWLRRFPLMELNVRSVSMLISCRASEVTPPISS